MEQSNRRPNFVKYTFDDAWIVANVSAKSFGGYGAVYQDPHSSELKNCNVLIAMDYKSIEDTNYGFDLIARTCHAMFMH